MSECLIIRSLLWMSYSQSCSIRNNSLFTKTTKTETRRSKMGPHMSGEKEREKLEGNLALIFFLFSEANIYPEDLKRKPILVELWQPLLVLREK